MLTEMRYITQAHIKVIMHQDIIEMIHTILHPIMKLIVQMK